MGANPIHLSLLQLYTPNHPRPPEIVFGRPRQLFGVFAARGPACHAVGPAVLRALDPAPGDKFPMPGLAFQCVPSLLSSMQDPRLRVVRAAAAAPALQSTSNHHRAAMGGRWGNCCCRRGPSSGVDRCSSPVVLSLLRDSTITAAS